MRPFVPVALTLLLTACGDGESLCLPDGGRYRGEVVNGLLQGQGRIDYPSGSWYAGQFVDGQWHGDGEWHGSNGEVYKGQFQHGLFHGQGTLTLHDSSYTGGFKLGRRNGEGTLKEAGMTYRGEFKDDQYSGLGHLELEDGSQYQGEFAHGKPNGEGQRSDSSGNQFTGRFVNGQLEGAGTFNSAEGDQYAGGFKHNQLNGKGRYENADGDVWIGEFKDGVLNGIGHLNLADGSSYIGEFASDTYEGRGILTLADGNTQSGIWANGQRVRDANGKLLPDQLELGLLAQGPLLDKALSAVPASTPAIELYSLVLAGDGKQSVFMREADYVNSMLASRFGAYGQISLVNHRDHLLDRPMATRENLHRAAQTLAERSGPEDLIFIYLTSHGTHDHELVLDQPRLELADLPADEMASALAPLKNRDKVIVISACYSGGFIPALKDEKTLIMTASRADRVSFGCSEEADFTYFGDALFAQALNQTDDLQQAFNLAKTHVAGREQADNFEASEPQIWAPKGVLAHWQQLRKQQARKALQSASLDSKEAKSN